MCREQIIQKAEDFVGSLRGTLRENEGSTLATIASSVKQGFESLKATVAENDTAQRAIAEINKQLDDLEAAIHKGDKDLTAKLLDTVEEKIREYKESNPQA